nr:serine protease gd isoform X1 [Halyomorpha halys]
MLLRKITRLFINVVSVFAIPQSPCPDYFGYETGSQGDFIGIVRVPTSLISLPITLKVELAIRVALKTKYVGMLMLSENPTVVLGNIMGYRSKIINYTIRFPLPSPLPYLQKIEVNNKTLCTGKNITSLNYVFGGVTTKILLEHTFPANPKIISNKVHDDPSMVADEEYTVRRIGEDCDGSYATGTGNHSWPWLVAIFVKDESGIRFQCAGSLITNRHLVTAAHCMKNHKNNDWDRDNFVIYFGNHDVEDLKSSRTQIRQVDNIIIHPEYNETNYVADIAVMKFKSIHYDKYISPICLWNGGVSLKPLLGRMGTVVGWGLDRTKRKTKKKPEVFQLPIVDQAECLRSRKEFLYITSERTICAGLRNGTGPCSGDSGSGLLILSHKRNSSIWYLRGIISLSLLDQNKETCNLNEYIVFTDVARFTHWLKNVTNH